MGRKRYIISLGKFKGRLTCLMMTTNLKKETGLKELTKLVYSANHHKNSGKLEKIWLFDLFELISRYEKQRGIRTELQDKLLI